MPLLFPIGYVVLVVGQESVALLHLLIAVIVMDEIKGCHVARSVSSTST